MEAPDLMEDGNIPQKRKFPCCQLAFYTSILVLITIPALFSVVFCLLHHKQAPGLCWAHGYRKYGDSRPAFCFCQTCCDKDDCLTALIPVYNCPKDRLKKSSTENSMGVMSWEWSLEHCDGFVQKDRDQYLIIEQSGNYFIYAQVNRIKVMEQAFTVKLCKEPNNTLNKVVGPQGGNGSRTINFGRPFFLQKGDKLYCQGNSRYLDGIQAGNETYWGLYKL